MRYHPEWACKSKACDFDKMALLSGHFGKRDISGTDQPSLS